jgi:hypothetical protein
MAWFLNSSFSLNPKPLLITMSLA